MVYLRPEKSHSFREAKLCGTNSWSLISKNDVSVTRGFIELVLLSCVMTCVATSPRAQGKKVPTPPCQPLEMMRLVYQGDLTKALSQSEACVAFGDADVESMSKSDPPNPMISLAIFQAGYYRCVEAQILAMMGSLAEAESALSHAEAFALLHSDYLLYPPDGMGSVGWRQVVSPTKGFVLEKKGDFKDARLTYLNAHMDDRLALLALKENDETEAWSRTLSGGGARTTTALAVLGALYELDGDDTNAFLSYSEAQKLMEDSFKPGHNDFMPMNLSESQRVSDGLRRLGAVASPKSLSFGSSVLGKTSTSKAVTMTNNLDATLTITSITASGDFAQTNTCGGGVPAKSKCTINVTFAPTQTGTRTGTLTIADDANNSPQTVRLTGTGE